MHFTHVIDPCVFTLSLNLICFESSTTPELFEVKINIWIWPLLYILYHLQLQSYLRSKSIFEFGQSKMGFPKIDQRENRPTVNFAGQCCLYVTYYSFFGPVWSVFHALFFQDHMLFLFLDLCGPLSAHYSFRTTKQPPLSSRHLYLAQKPSIMSILPILLAIKTKWRNFLWQ